MIGSLMEYLNHRTIDGERLDTLAWNYYGDASQFGPILKANPGLYGKTVTSAGAPLRIPIIEQPPAPPRPGLPPWL
jgi:phage tail protein X